MLQTPHVLHRRERCSACFFGLAARPLGGPVYRRKRPTNFAPFPSRGRFLNGVNVAALALMAGVTWELGRAALRDLFTVGLALFSALLLIRYKVNSAWLILGAAALGIGASLLRLF